MRLGTTSLRETLSNRKLTNAEEYDPDGGKLLGDFLQAFSHSPTLGCTLLS